MRPQDDFQKKKSHLNLSNLEKRYQITIFAFVEHFSKLGPEKKLDFFISYTLFHIQDIKKDMRITNCMIYLALSWKRLMIFVIQFQKRT